MKENEIRFLLDLDKERMNGTLQELLMRPNILNMPYHKALEYLVKQTLEEKKALTEENRVLSSVLKANNLYTRENVLPNHEEK
jgi:Mn-containing catalase